MFATASSEPRGPYAATGTPSASPNIAIASIQQSIARFATANAVAYGACVWRTPPTSGWSAYSAVCIATTAPWIGGRVPSRSVPSRPTRAMPSGRQALERRRRGVGHLVRCRDADADVAVAVAADRAARDHRGRNRAQLVDERRVHAFLLWEPRGREADALRFVVGRPRRSAARARPRCYGQAMASRALRRRSSSTWTASCATRSRSSRPRPPRPSGAGTASPSPARTSRRSSGRATTGSSSAGPRSHGVTGDLAIDKPLTYEIYLEMVKASLQPVAGVHAFLDEARAAGLRLAVATGSDRPKLEGNLDAIGLGRGGVRRRRLRRAGHAQEAGPGDVPRGHRRPGAGARALPRRRGRAQRRARRARGRLRVLGITSTLSAEVLLDAGAMATAPDFTAVPAPVREALGLG